MGIVLQVSFCILWSPQALSIYIFVIHVILTVLPTFLVRMKKIGSQRKYIMPWGWLRPTFSHEAILPFSPVRAYSFCRGFTSIIAGWRSAVDLGMTCRACGCLSPDQASTLQGSHGASCGILAVNDPGTGTGWQQSKQNWALLAVVGLKGWVQSRRLWQVQAAPQHLLH